MASETARSVRVCVPARWAWVATPVTVRMGQTLTMRAKGLWVDFYIPCGPEGYRADLLYALNRPPRIRDDRRYFRLMGRIHAPERPPADDDPEQTFVIGRAAELTAPHDGRLYVFANDGPTRYGNNWGRVTLEIDVA